MTVIKVKSNKELPPQKIYYLPDQISPDSTEPYNSHYGAGIPIAIDFGTSDMRIGLTNNLSPSNIFPSVISRYRDRKLAQTLTFVGYDVYLDSSFKSSLKTPFDGPLITNWDYVEWMLDYSFHHIGVDSDGFVDNPIVMSELLGAPSQQRKNMLQLLFEAYRVPKVTFGIDDLFSYYQNNGKNGLVIGAGNQAINIIPVINSKPILTEAKRINWGGSLCVDYLSKLINLKYPYFPSKINNHQFEILMRNHCYVSKDYQEEINHIFDLNVLEKTDVLIEAPYVENVQPIKTEEELKRIAEKRKESGRRLQEQAQKSRLEKLIQKEKDYEYYTKLKNSLEELNKKQIIHTLEAEGFDDESDFKKYYNNLEKSIKRARKADIGGNNDEIESETPPEFPLVDIPDDQLTEDQIKEKKTQKFLKANYDARKKAHEEKLLEKKRLEELEIQEEKWRKEDLNGWIQDKRKKLNSVLKKKKDRKKLREELNDRKSHAAQIRMKNIAVLAAENSVPNTSGNNTRSSKRKRTITIDNDPNDTFGANDDDWAIYRDIANVEDEDEIEEENQLMLKLEADLLQYDPNFSIENTYDSQFNWRKSIIHKFLRGPRDYDSEKTQHQYQFHMNIERIRVPETMFQPSIVGVDQAGISELSENIIVNRLPSEGFYSKNEIEKAPIINDIFLTGGLSHFKNFDERLKNDFTSFLPVNSKINIRRAIDPRLDAWRGMAKFSNNIDSKNAFITKQEYEEMGPDYIKEHNLGNFGYF
ncbi:actin-related protein ARP5 [Ascoidea rubescens DSM 1968]|uniref:Nuclear actin-related protein n=1 Tax=Ascoidea rubescens DSM 1968 TaxID=1344418 RepID=A0A1D2VCS4_9ASCO|nr:nuclear actin-related protein [Ascoidea rubescens DSM 1968]ODV59431.1 nuclear actin-related protein [Ascoidea rubescens DSM 1968]